MNAEICNITAGFALNKQINLEQVLILFKCAQITRSNRFKRRADSGKVFKSLTLKLERIGITALLYANGRVVLVGGKSMLDVENTCSFLFDVLGEGECSLKFYNFVGKADLGIDLSLTSMFELARSQANNKYCGSYDPELFPGFIWAQPDKNYKILMFRSGKAILTGCKTEQLVQDAFFDFFNLAIESM